MLIKIRMIQRHSIQHVGPPGSYRRNKHETSSLRASVCCDDIGERWLNGIGYGEVEASRARGVGNCPRVCHGNGKILTKQAHFLSCQPSEWWALLGADIWVVNLLCTSVIVRSVRFSTQPSGIPWLCEVRCCDFNICFTCGFCVCHSPSPGPRVFTT